MNDRGLLSEAEVVGVLEDAATSREHAAAASLAGEVIWPRQSGSAQSSEAEIPCAGFDRDLGFFREPESEQQRE